MTKNNPSNEAERTLERETQLPLTGKQEVDRGLEYGLEAAESIRDRTISTFSRGELPHYAGINTFGKAPYIQDVRQVGNYDVAMIQSPNRKGWNGLSWLLVVGDRSCSLNW